MGFGRRACTGTRPLERQVISDSGLDARTGYWDRFPKFMRLRMGGASHRAFPSSVNPLFAHRPRHGSWVHLGVWLNQSFSHPDVSTCPRLKRIMPSLHSVRRPEYPRLPPAVRPSGHYASPQIDPQCLASIPTSALYTILQRIIIPRKGRTVGVDDPSN